ncbi:MAG: hypothetical protein RQ731_01670 [Anaerosomatales bacterium]|nr:hypothetical protein [Anaerosomatales bacterium]MDT8433460.1 hypothetical protein [Anaerosomatales bacterium]
MVVGDTSDEPVTDGRSTVVEVFGVKLSVKNRRLAEILSMDAAEALGFEGKTPRVHDHEFETHVVNEASPFAVVAAAGPDDAAEAQRRTELRHHVEAIAASLGFTVVAGGKWHSPSGQTLHARVVSRAVSAAAAADTVEKLGGLMKARPAGESVVLITQDRSAAATFIGVIRERQAHATFRVVSVEDLEALGAVSDSGRADHAAFIALLSPQAAVDIGPAIAQMCPESPGQP